ncbi:hypothetical protein GGR54DRAFT_125043 [Hypoxylon sp. NC1633]|nr:hypothetical protein GGR54DRAFT_125043 [Hypoxylon sp. NC1633]
MMSFPAGGLLRTLSLSAIGSTNRSRIHRAGSGGGSGLSGTDLFAAELELKPWPAVIQPPTFASSSPTPPKIAIIADYTADQPISDEFRLPDPPKSAVLSVRKQTTPRSSLVVIRPIHRASSFDSTSSRATSASGRRSEEVPETRPPCNDATHQRSVRRKQQASQLCWREYWG